MWSHLVENPYIVAEKKLGVDLSETKEYVSTHTFFSYRKSDYQEVSDLFADELRATTYSKFRSADDVSRALYSIYYWYKGKIVIKDSHDVEKYNCKVSGVLIMNNVNDLETKDPCTFCLNDYPNISDKMISIHIALMRGYFPQKSLFEK